MSDKNTKENNEQSSATESNKSEDSKVENNSPHFDPYNYQTNQSNNSYGSKMIENGFIKNFWLFFGFLFTLSFVLLMCGFIVPSSSAARGLKITGLTFGTISLISLFTYLYLNNKNK